MCARARARIMRSGREDPPPCPRKRISKPVEARQPTEPTLGTANPQTNALEGKGTPKRPTRKPEPHGPPPTCPRNRVFSPVEAHEPPNPTSGPQTRKRTHWRAKEPPKRPTRKPEPEEPEPICCHTRGPLPAPLAPENAFPGPWRPAKPSSRPSGPQTRKRRHWRAKEPPRTTCCTAPPAPERNDRRPPTPPVAPKKTTARNDPA